MKEFFNQTLGMDLRRFLFEQMTEDITIQIENNIVDAFERWLPFVELRDIQINNRDENKIKLK